MNTRVKRIDSAARYGHVGHEEAAAYMESGEPVDDRPRSVYEIMTRSMLDRMREDVNDIKGRVNALLWMVAGAVMLELIMRLVK